VGSRLGAMLVGPFRSPLGIRGAICLWMWKKVGPIGGYQETPYIPDEPDAPDAKSSSARPWSVYKGVECVGLYDVF
jgi:hypothetical protein